MTCWRRSASGRSAGTGAGDHADQTHGRRTHRVLPGARREGGVFALRYRHAGTHEIIRDLRLGRYDVLVGINLLREGLDIPEVSLVAILDADKEGYLRSERSLIQTIGRAARHVNGQVILYADAITKSMRLAIDETDRRRELQRTFNKEHNITPESIVKSISDVLHSVYEADYVDHPLAAEGEETYHSQEDLEKLIKKLRKEMKAAADRYDFERAATLRDRIFKLEGKELELQP